MYAVQMTDTKTGETSMHDRQHKTLKTAARIIKQELAVLDGIATVTWTDEASFSIEFKGHARWTYKIVPVQ